MKKLLIAWLLVLALCLSMLAACADPSTPPVDDPTDNAGDPVTDEQPKAQITLIEDGTPKYAIVRADATSGNSIETKLSLSLKKALQSVTGAEFALLTDWEGKDDNAELLEILIGETNRPESKSAMEALAGENDYMVRVDGNKVVIVGNSEGALTDAVTYFLSTYAGWRAEDDFTAATTLKMNADVSYTGTWIDPEIVPDDGKPDVLYGLSQDQVDMLFADILDGLFTGDTTEVIVEQGIGREFGFHFPDIVYYKGQYLAYYITYKTDTGKGGVGLAVSDDGKTWTNKGCVIQPDEDWDMNGAYFAGVWIDDGTFYLVYECKGGETTEYGTLENVALATSYDGVNWFKEGVILYKNHSLWWQKANVGTPDLYKDGDTWYLFFHGFDYKDCYVGVAYGEDLMNLTALDEPIISTEDNTPWSGTIGRRDVIYCDGYYYMVYEISTDQAPSGGYGGAYWSHMFARSTDLINWEISSGPLLTQKNADGSDKTGFGYDGTCWMIVGRHLYVYMREGGSTTAVELVLK